jgi:hypothetical protein
VGRGVNLGTAGSATVAARLSALGSLLGSLSTSGAREGTASSTRAGRPGGRDGSTDPIRRRRAYWRLKMTDLGVVVVVVGQHNLEAVVFGDGWDPPLCTGKMSCQR